MTPIKKASRVSQAKAKTTRTGTGTPDTDPVSTASDAGQTTTDPSTGMTIHIPIIDSLISTTHQLNYWSNVTASVDGMLGGFPQVSRIDIQSSRNFIRKLQRLDPRTTTPASQTSAVNATAGKQEEKYLFQHCLEPGAGIGRVTLNLLAPLCARLDIIEPIPKFSAVLTSPDSTVVRSGQIRRVYNLPLQEWTPDSEPSWTAPEPDSAPEHDPRNAVENVTGQQRYDLIFNQWVLAHLSQPSLVSYLTSLVPLLLPGAWIIVKENVSSDAFGNDMYDAEDSCVTRGEASWRAAFEAARLRVFRTELQTGFPRDLKLLPVRMWALRPM